MKNCTPLWREAHLQVKVLTLLEVELSKKCTLLWRETHFEVKCKKLRGTEHFWAFRCRLAWQAQGIGHLVKSEQNVKVL
jgi:hypothetical protein